MKQKKNDLNDAALVRGFFPDKERFDAYKDEVGITQEVQHFSYVQVHVFLC